MSWWLIAIGCAEEPDDSEGLGGVAALGHESHDPAMVEQTVVGTSSNGLDVPRDLAFNPDVPGELWVVNRADDSVSIFFDAGTDAKSEHIVDPYALHFMEEVSSLAFGAPVRFGTCQESRNTYNNAQIGNDFMGPTLWSSDLDVFGKTNHEASEYLTDLYGFPTDLGSHLDMNHESPLCMGIAWESENVYWVFDGLEGSIDRNDFNEDHGPGYDNHLDGEIGTYAIGEVERVEDVPSHMVIDHAARRLYVADTGNNRIAVLEMDSGVRGEDRPATEVRPDHYYVDDAILTTFIDGNEHGMVEPSGLAFHDGLLFVGDHGTGRLWAFDMEGAVVDYLDLDADALMGIEVVGLDDIWLVDGGSDRLVRLQPVAQ